MRLCRAVACLASGARRALARRLLGPERLSRPPRHDFSRRRRRHRRQQGDEMIVDPWPAHSGNNNIAFNGQKMQSRRRALSHRQGHPAGRIRQNPESDEPGVARHVTQTTVNTGGALAPSVSTPPGTDVGSPCYRETEIMRAGRSTVPAMQARSGRPDRRPGIGGRSGPQHIQRQSANRARSNQRMAIDRRRRRASALEGVNRRRSRHRRRRCRRIAGARTPDVADRQLAAGSSDHAKLRGRASPAA